MRLAVVSPYAPTSGTPHAGGQYVWAHLNALATEHEVTLIAPKTVENGPGMEPGERPYRVVGTPVPWQEAGALRRGWLYTKYLGAGLGPGPRILASLHRSERALSVLDEADIIELQYGHSLAWVPALRARNPHKPISVVCHDIYTQALARQLRKGGSSRRRIEAGLLLSRVKRQEPRWINQCDVAIVFSDKDRQLLRALGVSSPIIVVAPPVLEPIQPLRRSPTPVAIFVAAFDRPANEEAALWLIREIWPRLAVEIPTARLLLVGGGVRPNVARLASSAGVEVTGQVPDLRPYYRDARVALAPLHQGAGVKFKVLDALANGVPVASTHIGAEGIDLSLGKWLSVANGVDEFIQLTANWLNNGDPGLPEECRSAVAALTSFNESMRKLSNCYESLLGNPTA